jgi:hypothetical protein
LRSSRHNAAISARAWPRCYKSCCAVEQGHFSLPTVGHEEQSRWGDHRWKQLRVFPRALATPANVANEFPVGIELPQLPRARVKKDHSAIAGGHNGSCAGQLFLGAAVRSAYNDLLNKLQLRSL